MQQLICYFSIIKNHSFPIALWIRASTSFLSIWLETLFCCCQFWFCSNPKLAAMQIIRMDPLCNIVSMLINENWIGRAPTSRVYFETSLILSNTGCYLADLCKIMLELEECLWTSTWWLLIAKILIFNAKKTVPITFILKFLNRDWYLSPG